MHTDYVIWDPINYFLPPSLMHRLVWGAVGVAMPYSMWLGYMWRIYVDRVGYYGYGMRMCYTHCGVYMGCIWENRVTEDSAGGGPCVRRAPPPCLALPASEQNPSIEYKNKTNSDTTATITNQTAHRLYSYTLHNIYYRTL